jgi:hypothetical protein
MGDPYPNQVAYYGILVINYVITLEIVENRQGHPPGRVAVYETVRLCPYKWDDVFYRHL